MNKIGILTYTSNYNMGTFWQAYASLKGIQNVFPDVCVEIVNYHRESIKNSVKYHHWIVPKKRHLIPRHLINDIRSRKKYQQCQKRYLGFDADQGLYCDNPDQAWQYLDKLGYDYLFVGSDTLLEFEEYHYRKNTVPIYWLPPDLGGKKFLLAASAGTHPPDLNRLSEVQRNCLKDSLSGFRRLGVRDEVTRDLLLSLTNQGLEHLEVIPDPTFLVDIDPTPAQRYLKSKGLDLNSPILGIDVPMSLPGLKSYLNRLESKGWQFVSWRIRHRKGLVDCSDIGPLEWAGIFRFFALTITNRFHASIFTLKNKRPVLSIDCKPDRYLADGWSKSWSLLQRFSLAEKAHTNLSKINGETDISRLADQAMATFDPSSVSRVLKRLKTQMETYLQSIADI